jgi:TP53 regulating kinase-like protein
VIDLLLKKGAEANIYLRTWYGRKVIVKKRIRKRYRLKEIDKRLRLSRTIHEAQLLHSAKRGGVPTPVIYFIDKKNTTIIMEFIEGKRLKELINTVSAPVRKRLCNTIGQTVGKLHMKDIIHGDLTTSNMIALNDDKICFIDFGLSYVSNTLEDKGVDLHLLKRTFNSTHFMFAEACFKELKRGYTAIHRENAKEIFKKVEEIERRGRYSERI